MRLSTTITLLVMFGCSSSEPCDPLAAVASARALDQSHVEVTLLCEPELSVEQIRVEAITGDSSDSLQVKSLSGKGTFVISTSQQVGLRQYTVRISDMPGPNGQLFAASVNFVGVGNLTTAPVRFIVDDTYDQALGEVFVQVSVDQRTGVFLHRPDRMPLHDDNSDHVFEAVVDVAVDPLRTVSESDDRLGEERRAYTAMAVDARGTPISKLVTFEVADQNPVEVSLRLLSVPPPPQPEGLVAVQVSVDDRAARALTSPTLRASIGEDGSFDPNFPTTLPLSDDDGDGVYEGFVGLRIDPERVIGGATSDNFPYVVFLANEGNDYPGTGTEIEVLNEAAQEVTIRVGNPNLVPVTFRIDASAAYLNMSGSLRGVFPGESVYLTGEFGSAEDAFGQNASDAFSGGENVVLQMQERNDFPGVWERTIFLPPNRPYGWKAVRCPSDVGCSDLNRKVTSSGRAFATVMKNLATLNIDGPPAQIVDPRFPQTDINGEEFDYTGARIYQGNAMGSEPNPEAAPNESLLFKQEVPDLVVNVGTESLTTPVIVVGSWRDVNLPSTLAEIIAADQVFNLSPYDYDQGFVGQGAPTYELAKPAQPLPFAIGDGAVDESAISLNPANSMTMSLSARIIDGYLYVATDDAGEGSDHFIMVGTDVGPLTPAPWGKRGQVAIAGGAVFVADENDGSFTGWFDLTSGNELTSPATSDAAGGVFEATLDLIALYGAVPGELFLSVAPYDSGDNGVLYYTGQFPAYDNADDTIGASELLRVSSAELEGTP